MTVQFGRKIIQVQWANKMKNNVKLPIIIFLLLMALLAAMILVQRTQETRRSAYFAQGSLSLWPSSGIQENVGDEVQIRLKAVPGEGAPAIQNVKAVICYGDELSLPENEVSTRVLEVAENGFDDVVLAFVEQRDDRNCLNLTVVADNVDRIKNEAVDVAIISFDAVAAGSGEIDIIQSESMISGNNPGELDKAIEITSVSGTSYTISSGDEPGEPSATPTEDPGSGASGTVKIKVAFAGVLPGAKCANWPLKVTLKGESATRTYDVNNLERVGTSGNNAVYEGSFGLGDFGEEQNLAMFIRGPKHIQVKYGVNNQSQYYNLAGGKLQINREGETSFDFSKYPLLAGDVTGAKDGGPDGVIDGRDFSAVKAEAMARTVIDEGSYSVTDLDGDCIHVSRDVTILMQSLRERQEQLY